MMVISKHMRELIGYNKKLVKTRLVNKNLTIRTNTRGMKVRRTKSVNISSNKNISEYNNINSIVKDISKCYDFSNIDKISILRIFYNILCRNEPLGELTKDLDNKDILSQFVKEGGSTYLVIVNILKLLLPNNYLLFSLFESKLNSGYTLKNEPNSLLNKKHLIDVLIYTDDISYTKIYNDIEYELQFVNIIFHDGLTVAMQNGKKTANNYKKNPNAVMSKIYYTRGHVICGYFCNGIPKIYDSNIHIPITLDWYKAFHGEGDVKIKRDILNIVNTYIHPDTQYDSISLDTCVYLRKNLKSDKLSLEDICKTIDI
jgi:hypothetical protein